MGRSSGAWLEEEREVQTFLELPHHTKGGFSFVLLTLSVCCFLPPTFPFPSLPSRGFCEHAGGCLQ